MNAGARPIVAIMFPSLHLPSLPPGVNAFDVFAVVFLVLAWQISGWLIENSPRSRPSVTVLMRGYRREWMEQVVRRDPRVFDATIITSLRESTAFFASTTMIAIGGGVALIGNVEWLRDVAGRFDISGSAIDAWDIKILLTLAIVARGFLSFVWSNRLHGYCAIMMAAIPNEPDDQRTGMRVRQAAELNIAASRHFGAGLRSIYFALGGLGWLIGPWWLVLTTGVAIWWVLMREFASMSRQVMLQGELPPEMLRH